MATSALLSAAAMVGCGGGNSDAASDSTASALAVPASDAATTDTTTATSSTDASATAVADAGTDSESMASALRYRRSGKTSTVSLSSTTTTAPTTVAATSTVATSTLPTTTVTTTTAAQASPASSTAVTLSWVSPAANAQVSGMQTVALSGQNFKNVEIFSAGVRIATATVSSDSKTAVATIDTTKLANGSDPLTAHAWNSAAGTAATSDADAGALPLIVSNTTVAATTVATTTAATSTPATTATKAAATTTNTSTVTPSAATATTATAPAVTTSTTTSTTVAATPATTAATTASTATTTAAATTSAAAATTTTAAAVTSTGPLMGTNIHTGGGNTSDNQKIADVMNSRQLKTARMDFNRDLDLTAWRDQVSRLKAYGIKAETSLQITYQWDYSCNQNLSAVEQDAYAQTVVLVQRIGDLVQDFELLNEVSLRPDTSAQVAPFQASPASAYAGKTCYATLASVLRGMSRAIVDQRNATGAPYRIILGTVSNDFGLLSFMQQQGVTFDVVGYHVYPSLGAPAVATDPWFGTGGLVGQLAQFNKPVRINEFNCGEIYASSYDNVAGSSATLTCLSSIQKHLKSLLAQKTITIDSVHAYELVDQPGLAGAEARFGLMYDLNTPKSLLAAYSLFSGGTVSSAEKTVLTTAGVTGK